MLGRYAILSIALHALVLLAAIFGILNYDTDVVDISQPISIELVEVIEDTPKTPTPKPEPEKLQDIPTPKKEESRPEPAPQDIPAIPDIKLEQDSTPQIPKPIADAPKPKPKPPVSKPKPKPKSKKTGDDFDALLKNLTKTDKTQKATAQPSDRLAASELEAVRKQIESVWRLPAGVKGIHTFTVSVTLSMNPDRTVRHATIHSSRHETDPTFRILSDSALRAVNEFKSKPLKLPPNRYKIWKTINMQFDPRHLL